MGMYPTNLFRIFFYFVKYSVEFLRRKREGYFKSRRLVMVEGEIYKHNYVQHLESVYFLIMLLFLIATSRQTIEKRYSFQHE